MPYKQGPDIDSKSFLLIRHHFYYLDMTASVDQNCRSWRAAFGIYLLSAKRLSGSES